MKKQTLALARGIAAIGVTAAVVVGATFAAGNGLTTQATLQNNTISSVTADLLLWNGSAFASTAPGFTVTGLIPGSPSGDIPFYFQNNSGDAALTITANVPTAPNLTGRGISDPSDVKIDITNDHTTSVTQTDLGALESSTGVALPDVLPAGATGNSTVPGTVGNYHFNVGIDPSGVTGSSVSVPAFDIVFTGTTTTP